MPEAAPYQVIDLIKARISTQPSLSGWTILSDHPEDVAFEDADLPVLAISLVSWRVDNAYMSGSAKHDIVVEFEVLSDKSLPGVLARNNVAAIGHIIAALDIDRTFGGALEDIQETDIAPLGLEGRDVSGTTLQAEAAFYTPRADWFTIVNP